MQSSRKLSAVAVAVTVPLLVTACLSPSTSDDSDAGPGAEVESDADADGPVTIEFWAMPYWGNDEQRIRGAVEEFNESRDDITVEFTALEWQDGRDVIKQAVAAGTGPDVFLMNNGLDVDYLESGTLASLSDLGYTDADINTYLPLVEINEYEGELYGAPLFVDAVVLVYRPDILAQYGYDAPPADWDELKEIAAAITTGSNEEIWGWQFKGMDDHLNAIHSTWQTFLWQAGGQFTSADFTQSAQNSPAGEEAMAFMRSFYDEGISPVGTSAENGFVSGNVAMFNFYQTVNVADTDGEWAMAPMPMGPANGASIMGGHSLVANAASDHLDAAGEFMRHLASPELSAQYMADFRAIFPYDLEAVSEETAAEVEALVVADPNWVGILEQLNRAEPAMSQQDRNAFSARWNAQASNVVAGVNGQSDISDALTAIDAEINEALGG